MSHRQGGFTLLELIVVFAVLALAAGVTVPLGSRMYETMKYREVVREIRGAIQAARYKSITSGKSVDWMMNADERIYAVQIAGATWDAGAAQYLSGSEDLSLSILSAEEIAQGSGVAAIRFFPEGSSTGGSVIVERETGGGVHLRVGWLLGRITEELLDQP